MSAVIEGLFTDALGNPVILRSGQVKTVEQAEAAHVITQAHNLLQLNLGDTLSEEDRREAHQLAEALAYHEGISNFDLQVRFHDRVRQAYEQLLEARLGSRQG